MNKKVKKLYKGTAELVYLVALIAWKNYTDHLAKFSSFNGKYTNAYAANAVAAAEAAAALPGESVRKAALKIVRKHLLANAKLCLDNWQTLARYIVNAFDADMTEVMRQAAGAKYYALAQRRNWKQLTQLCEAAIAFIDKYSTELQQQGKGMPNDFAAQFAAAKASFDATLKQYNDTKQELMQQTAARTIAFNEVYATLIAMLKDGRRIFANDKKVKNMFVFSALGKMVTPAKKSGLHIEVVESDTLQPITTTTFTFQPGNVTAFVNAAGTADVVLPAGIYTLVATTPGYATFTLSNVAVKAGSMRRIQVMLTKAVAVA